MKREDALPIMGQWQKGVEAGEWHRESVVDSSTRATAVPPNGDTATTWRKSSIKLSRDQRSRRGLRSSYRSEKIARQLSGLEYNIDTITQTVSLLQLFPKLSPSFITNPTCSLSVPVCAVTSTSFPWRSLQWEKGRGGNHTRDGKVKENGYSK